MPLALIYRHFSTAADVAVTWLAQETAGLRTGRASAGLIESLPVEHYGTRTPLNGLASISSVDARTLVIAPWDPGSIPAIERAITVANVGASPAVDGKIVRLSFPSLNEEMRVETIKRLHRVAEEARVRLRRSRDDALGQIRNEKEAGTCTEDDFYLGRQELDRLIGVANDRIEHLVTTKETEIRTI